MSTHPHGHVCTWCDNSVLRLMPQYFREAYVEDSRPFKDRQISGREGCDMCALLCAGVIALVGNPELDDYEIRTWLVPRDDKSCFTIEFRYSQASEYPKIPSEQLKVYEFCSATGDRDFTKSSKLTVVDHGFSQWPLEDLRFMYFTPAPGHERFLAFIHTWLAQCQSTHSCCQSPSSTPLPHRVVDVGTSDGDGYPKLYQSHGELGQYTALSHCWGTTQHFTTESTNLDERCKGISWDLLPQTFQDAIYLTRNLGIRYLWIDSLCILQDDSTDWDSELSKMTGIYKNAYITIAASSAVDDQAGFLGATLSDKIVSVDVSQHSCFPTDLKVREVFDTEAYSSTVEPLNTRAWAFQERLLPQRILSFSSVGLKWECNKSTWTESHRAPSDEVTDVGGSRSLYHSTLIAHRELSAVDHPSETTRDANVYSWWSSSVVPTYARLALTKEEDKLAALSAIANEVQKMTNDVYLAGLWKKHLLLCLSWRSSSGTYQPNPGRLPSKYRAPSWSWASIESVSITGEKSILVCEHEARVLGGNCEKAGINPTGPIRSGFIRLYCRWFHSTLNIAAVSDNSDESSFLYAFDGLPIRGYGRPALFWPDSPLVEGMGRTADGGLAKTIRRSDVAPGTKRPAFSAPVSCIFVCQLASKYFVLMVLGQSATKYGAFERLGIIRFHEVYLDPDLNHKLSWGEFLIV